MANREEKEQRNSNNCEANLNWYSLPSLSGYHSIQPNCTWSGNWSFNAESRDSIGSSNTQFSPVVTSCVPTNVIHPPCNAIHLSSCGMAKHCQRSLNRQSSVGTFCASHDLEERDSGSSCRLETFTNFKARIMSSCVASSLNFEHENSEGYYARLEPIEHYMQVHSAIRRELFYKLLEPGDIVLVHVDCKKSYGVFVILDSFDGMKKHRYISDLKIEGFIGLKELGENFQKVLTDLQLDDVIRALVLKFDRKCIQLRSCDGSSCIEDSYSSMLRSHDQDELCNVIQMDPAFCNPHCVTNLLSVTGIKRTTPPSLFSQLHSVYYPENEYFDILRSNQRYQWSMDNVAMGVNHFKAGDHEKALKYLDHALEIDGNNVEGLVAHGALIANAGKYQEAIGNFEKALNLNNQHSNARRYLAETQAALGKQRESAEDVIGAIQCYKEAIANDKYLKSPQRRVQLLEQQIAKQHESELEEKLRKKKKLAAKLRRLMEEDKSKKKRKSKKKKDKHLKKKHQATYSCSSSDTD